MTVGECESLLKTFVPVDASGGEGDGQHFPLPEGRLQRLGRRRGQRLRLSLSGLSTDQLPQLPGHSRQFRQLQGIPGSGLRRRRDQRRRKNGPKKLLT